MGIILAASAVVRDDAGRFLLVRRRNEPEAGTWTVPGGRLEMGETMADAAAREVLEETGIIVTVGAEVWSLTIPTGAGDVYEIHDFLAVAKGGHLKPGDDATDAQWFTLDQMRQLPLTDDLLGYLTRAGLVGNSEGTDHNRSWTV